VVDERDEPERTITSEYLIHCCAVSCFCSSLSTHSLESLKLGYCRGLNHLYRGSSLERRFLSSTLFARQTSPRVGKSFSDESTLPLPHASFVETLTAWQKMGMLVLMRPAWFSGVRVERRAALI
jgi:hypothetical protein